MGPKPDLKLGSSKNYFPLLGFDPHVFHVAAQSLLQLSSVGFHIDILTAGPLTDGGDGETVDPIMPIVRNFWLMCTFMCTFMHTVELAYNVIEGTE